MRPPTTLKSAALCALGLMAAIPDVSRAVTAPPADGSRPYGQAVRWAVPFTQVRLQDAFWDPRQEVYRDRTIPHSWQYVAGEIRVNEIVAGRSTETPGDAYGWAQANLHKVLETCAYALVQKPNPELAAKLDAIIAAIAGAQQPDGYVNATITAQQKVCWTNLDGQHEGYTAGHMIEAAVAHYLATGKSSFLDVARRMADHIHRHFIVEKNPGVCGHAELELALVRLYRVTGEKKYLDLAKEWIERRGKPGDYRSAPVSRVYFMDHLPIRDVPEVGGHAVRTMFYLTGVAEVATETGDESLKDAARRLWLDTTRRKMYLTGSVGSEKEDEAFGPAYDLPNRGGYSESCAACGLLYYAAAMFTMDGEAESIDVLERVLYNAVLHGISLDGTSTYYNNPLADENHVRDNCWVCCPPCLSRTLLRVQDYVYAQTDNDLYVNLFAGSTADVRLGQGNVRVTQETRYPWDGQVKLRIDPAKRMKFSLRLRIPGWARDAKVTLNGKAVAPLLMEKGYAVLKRRWVKGDTVEMTLPMPVERVQANPAVKENTGRVAIQRGPVIFGFEGLDNGGAAEIVLPASARFNAEFRPDFLGGIVAVTVTGADGLPRTAIPFYTMANRERSSQVVWVRQEGEEEPPASWDGLLYRKLTVRESAKE